MHAPAIPTPAEAPEFRLRTFRADDQAAVELLFEQGLLAGQIAPNDTGADIDCIAEAYLEDPRHHFWVAENAEGIVGMIGVASDDENTAEIRRLRVRQDLQTGRLAAELLETALGHCRKHGYLKVRLDTRFERDDALETFERIGFRHTRDRSAPGKSVLEFYADLYRQREEEPNQASATDTPKLVKTRPISGKVKVS